MPIRAFITTLIAANLAACMGPLPQRKTSEALHRDLERIVSFSETQGWRIDRSEIEDAMPAALMSVCRATLATRDDLELWLDQRIEALGGPVEDAFQRRGRKLSRVDDLLMLTRIRLLLTSAGDRASTDCPFWLSRSSDFRGRQILDDRWLLSFGGGGKVNWVREDGHNDLNFGGAGRLLVGRAFGRYMTFLTGVQVGGSASLPLNEEGTGRTNLVIGIDTVIPLVYRHRLVSTYYEVEAGYVAHVTEDDLKPRHGVHVGAAFGVAVTRTRWVFAGAAFGVSYERIVEDKILHVFKAGFRGAIDLAD
jgi:hypothetical protein